jgi:hypothetical protein
MNSPLRLHPVLALALLQPQLLLDHAAACSDLLLAEAEAAAGQWRRRGLCWALAAGCGLLAAMLAGTALLLWASLPAGSLPHPQAMAIIPLLPLLPGLLAWHALGQAPAPAFTLLRQQLAGDLHLMRQASAVSPAV